MPDEKDYIDEILRKQLITGDHFKDPSKGEQVTRQFGKYELASKIGEGASGEIYLAYDKSLSRHVAIKILQRMNKQDIQRFQREAEYLAKLSHPNIVQVYEISEFQGQPYIAMQYIHGESPDKINLNINQALSVIKQVAQALQYAHSLSIIHRDIKPTNIVIDKNFRAYLMDFGIAKQVIDKTSTISLTGSIIGTPAFMSPEQAKGEIHKIDARTDIYGLGSTLYYLVTHMEPFSGSSTIEIINKVEGEEPPEPRKIDKRIPKDVEAIIMKAMAKEKSSRYQTASDFIHDIDLYLSGEPVMAKRTSIATRIIKRIKRRKSLTFAALFILGILSIAFYFLSKEWQKFRSQKEALLLINKGMLLIDQALKMSYNSESESARIRERLEKAIQIFDRSIEKYPLAIAYYRKGKIYRELAKYQDAQKELAFAIKIDPKMDVARIERSYVRAQDCVNRLYIEGDVTPEVLPYLDEALKDIENIKEEGLESEEARQMRTFIFAVKKLVDKKYDEAVNLLKHSEAWNENEDFLHWLGVVYCFKKDFDLSIEFHSKALNQRPHYSLAYLSRAWSYLRKKELMSAMDDLDKAIYINPWLAAAYMTRGSIYYIHNQLDNALADSNKVIELMPDSEIGHVNRGQVFYKKGDFEAALVDFNKAIQINPRCIKAYVSRGGFFDDLKQYDKALEDYNKAISIDSSYFLIYYNRGLTYYNMQDVDRALADFQRCIQLNPHYSPAHVNMGCILTQKGDTKGALECFNTALETDKNYAPAYKARGIFYFNTGSFDLAEADLKKAIELDPGMKREVEPFLDQIKKRAR